MARAVLLVSLVVLILLAATTTVFAVLAAYSPLQPGHFLFSMQELAESTRANLAPTNGERMDYAHNLLDRRSHDLARMVGQPAETTALHALDRALNRVALALAALSPQQRLVNSKHIFDHASEITEILDRMRQIERDPPHELESLSAKVAALRSLVQGGPPTIDSLMELSRWALSSPAPVGNFSLAMLRLGESGGFTHAMFPLSQHHTTLTCVQCHTPDEMNARVACQTCHADKKPAVHYEAPCDACHFTSAWVPARMNHFQAGSDCRSCHLEKRPAGHFSEQCSLCHSAPSFSGGLNAGLTDGLLPIGEAWRIIHFNHAVAGVTDCQGCHQADRPVEHFNGQCSQCHAITGFFPSSFAHPTGADCATCHIQRKPANHYYGACQVCHTAPLLGTVFVSWKGATFTHPVETDCASCHIQRKPANHYVGQCSDCHTIPAGGTIPAAGRPVFVGWKGAQYTHSTASTACDSCHASHAPAVHFNAQCSVCHAVPAGGAMPTAATLSNGWRGAVFNHQAVGATNCVACHASDKLANHYAGQCSSCHTSTSAWYPVNFNHSAAGVTDCLSCHLNSRPPNHYSLQCSLCHPVPAGGTVPAGGATASWYPIHFDHAAAKAIDCISCHTGDKPANHYAAQCSGCHTTTAWQPVNFNHALAGATNCLGCHTGDKPANHFTAQCSSCHTTTAWLPVNFNHAVAGATDCLACHTGDKPLGHVSTQCSACHSTSAWKPATFTHRFPLDHGKANGKCLTCHPSSVPAYTCYSCHSETTLRKVHAKITPIPADCMNCHPDGKVPDDD